MPSGGQIPGSSPGLRLQANTPGVVDVGNADISGTMIATRGNFVGQPAAGFFSMTPFIGLTNPGNPYIPVMLGDQAAINWIGPGNNLLYGPVCIGAMASVNQANGNIQSGHVCIGASSETWTTGGIAIGNGAMAGGHGTDNGNTGAIAIGPGSQVQNYGGYSSGPGISFGYGVTQSATINTTHGSRNSVLIGAYVHEYRDVDPGFATGGNICIGAPTGGQYTLTSVTNAILIGTNVESGFTTTGWVASDSNSIQIGGTSHTKIKIGGRDLTSIGATRTVADVAAVATNQDGTLIYTSITAARIVTLPAANTCPPGFRFLVLDQSGSASGVNTITLTRAGADTVNGGTTAVITSAYGYRELITDGVSKWTLIR